MSTKQQGVVPRRSQRVAVDLLQSDGDTWRERIAVCESVDASGKFKLLLRSYYRNSRTGARVWDEPPSGASNIQHATPEMRQKAELQLQELQLTLEMIPEEEVETVDKKKKKGLFGRFRGQQKKKQVDDSKDLNLQKAIARSMAHQSGAGSSDEPVVYYDPDNNNEDDEDLALAKTMSLSVESMTTPSRTEEEMLQQALAASQREAQGVAEQPVAAVSVSQDMDKKMPAHSFDPYGSAQR